MTLQMPVAAAQRLKELFDSKDPAFMAELAQYGIITIETNPMPVPPYLERPFCTLCGKKLENPMDKCNCP